MKNLFVFAVVLCIASCDTSVDDISKPSKNAKVWVDMELEVKKQLDTIDYFYAGQIDANTIQELKLNKPGLFELSKVRYFRDDSIFKYEDDADEGTIYFNRRDVVKFSILKGDPFVDSAKTEKIK